MKDTIYVSPYHDIAPNSTDLEYLRGSVLDDNIGGGDLGEIEVVGPPTPTEMAAPSWVRIKSHTVRTAADGTQTVDVTFEVEDIVGATSYDMRTTKLA